MFAIFHKGLRYAGAHAIIDLGKCAGDPGAIDRALRATRELLDLHEVHQRVEDQYVITAIEARRPGAAARLVDAHADHEHAITELRRRVAAVSLDPAPAVLHRLYLEVTRFVADSALHMYEEETLAQPLLEEIYSYDELVAIAGRARDSVAPEEHQLFAGYLLPAMSHVDRGSGQKNQPIR
jgi:hypothetical protein